jgi:murein DD-endopeptidase MepM/ murein hydrolase activator NlpD
LGRKPGPTMTKIFNIGRYLRPRRNPVNRLKKAIAFYERLLTDGRFAGHPISRFFRRIFENRRTARFFGINLTILALISALLIPPASAFSYQPEAEITNLDQNVIQVTTEDSVRVPTQSFRVTQGYHLFHQAIDLDGELGEPVFPIMDGFVEKTEQSRVSYGNYVVINHNSGYKSLYAHLSKITVQEGQEVDKNTVIGTIGATGWATGPHLHLEVFDHERPINPLTILR